MKKIIVTGANGFIGKSLCQTLHTLDKSVRGLVRTLEPKKNFTDIQYKSVGDFSSKINWKDYLNGYDCIVHCAGKAHVMKKYENHDVFHLANTESTRLLAEQAAEVGVKRFIYLSTVKVNGESAYKIEDNKIFKNNDIPKPQDDYSISKFKAERLLWEISARTGLEVVVLRLPLVYGKDVKGNLARLMKLIKLGIPLPLSLVQNQRSMIGIDNLINIIIKCIDHPIAAGKTFLVSDGDDLSTPELINYLATSMGHKARLFPFPVFLLKLLGSITGKQKEINRLVGSLKVDISYTKEVLNWKAPFSSAEGIRKMGNEK